MEDMKHKFNIGDIIIRNGHEMYSWTSIYFRQFTVMGVTNGQYTLKASNFWGDRDINFIDNNFHAID